MGNLLKIIVANFECNVPLSSICQYSTSYEVPGFLYDYFLMFCLVLIALLAFVTLVEYFWRHIMFMDEASEQELIEGYKTPQGQLQTDNNRPAIDFYCCRVNNTPKLPETFKKNPYAVYDDNDTEGESFHKISSSKKFLGVTISDQGKAWKTNALMASYNSKVGDNIQVSITKTALDASVYKNNIYAYGRPLTPIAVKPKTVVYSIPLDEEMNATV